MLSLKLKGYQRALLNEVWWHAEAGQAVSCWDL